jgi:hypothetical protein
VSKAAIALTEILQAFSHAVVDVLTCLADLRLVEQAEPQVKRDVADHRTAAISLRERP